MGLHPSLAQRPIFDQNFAYKNDIINLITFPTRPARPLILRPSSLSMDFELQPSVSLRPRSFNVLIAPNDMFAKALTATGTCSGSRFYNEHILLEPSRKASSCLLGNLSRELLICLEGPIHPSESLRSLNLIPHLALLISSISQHQLSVSWPCPKPHSTCILGEGYL